MSSGRSLRRRSSSNGRRNPMLPPHPSSPSLRRGTPPTTPRKSEPNDDILHKCYSEPLLPGFAGGSGDNDRITVSDGRLYRPMTCTNVFSTSEHLRGSEKVYQEDYKVVVTVTLEGSTGPVRTMVKLGSSVDETIKLALDQYSKEGRNPSMDKDSASQYELHLSYFSFQSLDGSGVIGSLRSRNFFLRKRKTSNDVKTKALDSEMDSPEVAAASASAESDDSWQPCALMVFLPAYISRKIAMILSRIRKLWEMFGCLHEA
ncbi:hypothetical protein V2J09_014715 [Rumex salicifolius]